ncbi:hypothetical protein [Paenibacillus harenae]|uniref:hypothetical protein n=1 Tax=Paenibacillus harenae TaxID=306543 RepID=UPI0003F59C4C|nr:hypothetical protein [Paenibacillus harenae]
MIKMLNKTDPVQYWEIWYNEDDKEINIHFGQLGAIGEHITEAKRIGIKKLMEKRAEEKMLEGYEYLDEDELHEIMIQYKTGEDSGDDLEIRYHVESLMDECLGWTGNGHCDGGDYGSGTMNVFCLVVDVDIAVKTIISELEQNKLLADSVIAYANGDDYISVYPERGGIVHIF